MAETARNGPRAVGHPGGPAARDAKERVNALVAASFAPATMTRYKGIWKSFRTFAGVEPDWAFPSLPQMLAQYGVCLLDQGYKPATVATHLAGVGWWHKIKGREDPSRNYLVKRLLIGMAKEGPPPKQATPIRLSRLRDVLEQLPVVANAYDAKLFRAAFLLAYFASLRVSEYADTASKHAPLLKDVGFVVDGA